jgi:hypothetical protein
MKRMKSLILALALAASLSACSTSGNDVGSRESAESLPPSMPETASSPASLAEDSTESEDSVQGSKILVAYFSATGSTENVAKKIAEYLDADLFEIIPETPYTEADLDYNSDCRANDEQQDDAARPAIAAGCVVEDMADYDVVFLGHPIWWGIPPKIMRTFAESYDWSGKTIIPFCTSGSSGYSSEGLPELTGGAQWLEGRRFSEEAAVRDVAEWIDGFGLDSISGKKDVNTLTVQCGDHTVIYELNDSPAAWSLLAQLPLTLEVQPYSTNEQTFYPPEKLDIADTPAITSAGAGTLAYFAPWGDVVMFYEDFSGESSGLYELGRAVDGTDYIRGFSGTVTVLPPDFGVTSGS